MTWTKLPSLVALALVVPLALPLTARAQAATTPPPPTTTHTPASTDAAPSSGAKADGAKSDGAQADGAKPADRPCQIAIMSLQTKGLPADQSHVPELLSDSMATEIAAATSCRVITQADIGEMLDFEAQKAACSEASESCLAEIGGALGVERVIGGSLGMLGSSFKLQVKLQNVMQGRVEKRVDRTIKGDPELLDIAARNAARELFDLPPLDEGAAQAKADGTAAKDGQAQGAEGSSSTTAEEGGGFGGVLLGVGIAAAALGIVVAVVGTGLFAWVEASVATGAVPHFGLPRSTLFLIDVGGVGLLASGLVLAAVGGGVGIAGAFME